MQDTDTNFHAEEMILFDDSYDASNIPLKLKVDANITNFLILLSYKIINSVSSNALAKI